MLNLEKLEVWKRGCRRSVEIYRVLANVHDYGLVDQMTRAAVSIPSNIAEGAERKTDKEYINFLHIAIRICCRTANPALYCIEIRDDSERKSKGSGSGSKGDFSNAAGYDWECQRVLAERKKLKRVSRSLSARKCRPWRGSASVVAEAPRKCRRRCRLGKGRELRSVERLLPHEDGGRVILSCRMV